MRRDRRRLHPATFLFPPALAVAQALGRSGADLLVSAVAARSVFVSATH